MRKKKGYKKHTNPMKTGTVCYNQSGQLYLALGGNYLWFPRTRSPSFHRGRLFPDSEFWTTLEGEEWEE